MGKTDNWGTGRAIACCISCRYRTKIKRPMKDYSTLSEARDDLRGDGYTANLSTKEDHLVTETHDHKLYPKGFDVDHIF